MRPLTAPKKTLLLREGDVCRDMYIIECGCLRLYCIRSDGEEITLNFSTEGAVGMDPVSFFRQKPGRSYLETLEDCRLSTVRHADIMRLFNDSPDFNSYGRRMAEYEYTRVQERLENYIMLSAEERYKLFMQQRPDLIARVPQHYIATYIGVTPVTLSCIRKRLARQV